MRENTEKRLHIKRKILIVDDEEVNRLILGNILGDSYDVFYAENGQQALDVLRENPDTISLILLDIIMPVMDGYQVLETVRKDDLLKHIPIIVLTSDQSAEVKTLQMGAVDFIVKPYHMPEVIRARVDRSVELSEDNQMIRATQRDSLTDLLNRDFFMQYVEMLDKYHADTEMDAIAIDINHFHLINEMHGRSFGDRILRRIGEALKEIVTRNVGVACRNNADQFLVYIEHKDDQGYMIDEIMKHLKDLMDASSIRLREGVYPTADKKVEPMKRFDYAIQACNSIREKYTDFIAVYDREMHEKEAFSERLINEIDEALSEGQLEVYYQPKYDITGDQPVLSSAEALIRWKHPELGMIRPDQFIPLFERNGLIRKVDRFVWQKAGEKIRYWKDTYGVTIPVSVNASRIDIQYSEFVDEIMNIIQKNKINSSSYFVEVTESAFTEDLNHMVDVVDDLRRQGIKVEMDDFGSGYSSLNMLTKLSIDVLKLDMGFIRNIDVSEKDYHMVELMMDIANFLNIPVVAEGVETERQCQLLKQTGCQIIQGYYFSKPLPEKEFDKLIEKELEKQKNADN